MNFLELYTHSKNKIKVELDLSNYAAKSDLKSAAGVDADELDVDELRKKHQTT